ncbi:Glycosyl-hydrolase 97 C-terminal, oligomerisation [Sinomicrobium oceani]|uniref:Glycosyl-hydrolase 97 C-terminal, oligomerisation n=1 Tax=Sinomicrobium oceani TaxID=1150368 RepID=A0A1K1RTY2_9FLAO|nr:glycoside hydrolase family 97 protein [Sinomicrobium oceani]SFW75510.1 Glycosyl-hydrolase 97 C-terminal, oligomerisation [Sinomicrobium oceani]
MLYPIKTAFLRAFISLLMLSVFACTDTEERSSVWTGPDKNLKVTFGLSADHTPFYLVTYRDSIVLDTSRLGMIREDGNFYNDLSLLSVTDEGITEDHYQLLYGKQKDIAYKANRYVAHLKNKKGALMDIEFQLSDDGFAFRYYFPENKTGNGGLKTIKEEKTTYKFPGQSRAWLQPMAKAKTGWEQTNPSYEENYLAEVSPDTPSPIGEGWVYPALFRNGDTWALVSETAPERNFCATRLRYDEHDAAFGVTFPQEEEVYPGGGLLPASELPWYSPWRLVVVGDLGTITASTLGTDLARPAPEDTDTSYIRPGTASWSWALLKDESITYDIQKEFIDYASDMQWPYCLVDVNWDTTIGYDKIAELADYARTKNVKLILWYNSAGSWNTTPYHPRNKLLTAEKRREEFGKLQDMGIAGIKVDFFGGDGQSMIAYYHDIFTDAARYQLLVNCHGTTLPRGWQRTYPHLVTMESVKGFEFITFSQETADLAPEHCAILPFTRNVFDPMDFTPMSLTGIPNINRRTTGAFELALPVLFLSGIQHIAETAQGMSEVPDYVREYLKALPTDWETSRFIDGYPGKYAVFARQKGDHWYVCGINGEHTAKDITIDLSFIKSEVGYMITDDPEAEGFAKSDLFPSEKNHVVMQPYGGFVMKF